MNLSQSTIDLCHELLRVQIGRYYDDPAQYLGICFDKPGDVDLVGKDTAPLRIAADELGLDFDKLITDNEFIARGVERLKELIRRAMDS